MSRLFRLPPLVLHALAACALAPAMLGCNKSSNKMTIAVIPKGTTHAYWKSVEAGATKAGSDLGVEVIWKGPLKEDDRSQQIGIVQDFVSEGVSGICVAPLDDTALLSPVQSAAQKKIPVVIFDSPLKGEVGKDFVSLVATDNRHAGELGGEELARLLGNKGKVVLLRYSEGHASTGEREAGFLDAMAKHPDVQVIQKDRYAGATAGEAQTAAMNMVDTLKEADGIFCPNESSTEGMLRALQDSGLTKKVKFVGFDATPSLVDALKKDEIQALVTQDPQKMGYEAVSTMVKSLKGETFKAFLDTGAAVVTKENLADPAIRKMIGP